MRRRHAVAALAALAIPLLLPYQQAVAQGGFEYAGKIVCGPQPDAASMAVVRGYYATSVNVRNPSARAPAKIRKWVVWTYPTEKPEMPVAPVLVHSFDLPPRNAFTSECREVEATTKANPSTFHEGFFYVQSDQPLDVIGLYTAANLLDLKVAGQVSTMHIDRFTQRALPQ